MWILRSQKNGKTYQLLVGQTYSVGRKDVDILIESDPSISRRHATLTVTHEEGNLSDPAKLPTLKIQDVGSKYGTTRNGDRVTEEQMAVDGDHIKFGQFESVFSVSYIPFVVTTSCVDSSVKKELKKAVHQLGGHLVSDWKLQCTHLVMSDIKVTIKAVCCLISQKPLVSPEYITDMVKNISSGLSEPVPDNYLPPVGEAAVDKEKANFGIVPERKGIFLSKRFIFLDKSQYKKMQLAVTLGGGLASLFNSNVPVESSLILKEGTCVVHPQVPDPGVSICQNTILDLLQRNNKRMIQESDFGLAVAYCSTEMYCNPDYINNTGQSQFGFNRLVSQTLTQHDAYMHGTSGNRSLNKKFDSSLPTEKITTFNQSSSVQEMLSCNMSERKRKKREGSGDGDANRQCKKQTKLEQYVNISSSKSSNQEKVADSINIEGIALRSSAVKEEPQSADEMEVNSNSVVVESLHAPRKRPASSVVELNSSIESPSHHSAEKSSRETKRHRPLQNSKITSTSESGFLNSKNMLPISDVGRADVKEKVDEEEDLPRNLIQVEFADLIYARQNRTKVHQNKNTSNSTKNFKKFRKVIPIGARILPQIIGGHELEPYSKQASKALEEILNDSCDIQASHNLDDDVDDDEAGEFDWESQSRPQRKK